MKQLIFILTPLVLISEAMAESDKKDISLGLSLGVLNGASKELVYDDTGRKLSQLDWRIDNVPIIKLETDWNINQRWTLTGDFWSILIDDGNAHMEDRDWFIENQHFPTDISISPKTTLKKAYQASLHTTYWLFIQNNYEIGALGGFQYNQFKWEDLGGTYSYNNGTDVGTFPDVVGIDYKQEFGMFYAGLTGKYRLDNSEFSFLLKLSPWVKAKDVDNHYLRNLTFYEKSNEYSDAVSLSINYNYNFGPNMNLYTEYAYTRYFEANADMTKVNNKTNDSSFSENAAGLDNLYSTLSIGLKYSF
ncbi:omptin family protease OmpT [Aliivibrio fischeri ES114]|uniref:Omptin family protease OmpT n=1 Tax=Aliivibrio fischeri (strain ATCC 700601 / ES114) TaxID=312309 RepID=Q5E5F5_ALIF1|nr:omptin family outer membrane protease [Aliivibrio fischeri]AAW85741.1 omptin family protease OmpT [Aliivibrio fischeri ES114]KLU79989.1 peptidase [Aliivibrio fischeri]